MLVTPAGGRLWRFRYRLAGVEKLLALGAYPDVPLKRARERRDDARRLLAEGIDPSVKRRAEKNAAGNTFEAIAREWLALQAPRLGAGTLAREISQLERFIFPELGARPIAQITPPEVLGALRRVEALGIHDTAHRTRSACSRIFRFAVATGRAERDVTVDLGACQGSCRLNYAADAVSSLSFSEALTTASRSGLSVTASMGCQLRVCSDHRRGFSARARVYSA